MRIFVFFLLLLMFIPAARAEGVFYLEEKTQTTVDPLAPQSGGYPDKIEDYAKGFYDHCMSDPQAVSEGVNQDYLCSCVAAQIIEQSSIESLNYVRMNNTSKGRMDRALLNALVYEPCMPAYVNDVARDSCMESDALKNDLRYREYTCQCFGQRMKETWLEAGMRTVKLPPLGNFSGRPVPETTMDPAQRFFNHADYSVYTQTNMQNCISESMNPGK